MSERTLAVAVAQGPNPGDTGPQLIIDLDESVLINLNAAFFESQVGVIGHSPNCDEYMRACDLRRADRTIHVCCHRPAIRGELNAFGVEAHLNTLCLERGLDRRGYFYILVGQQTRLLLYHCDVAAKASIHLREFKADVTSADDDQMRRQLLELEKRRAGQI